MTVRVPLLLALTLMVGACEKQQPQSDAPARTDAGAPKAEALDPSLAKAMAAASAAPRALDAQTEGGPPPNGIFTPGAADKEITAGHAPKLTLGSEGSEPRVTFSPQPKPGAKRSGTIQVVQQSQGSGLPLEFAVTIEAQKPKTPEAPVPVSVRVTGVRISVSGAPKDVEAQVAKLKGARVDYEVSADGAGTGYRYEVPKGAPAELADMVRALSDAVAAVTLPMPSKPVGAGGFWMVTSRDGQMGLDLVTYRMVKVEKVQGDKVTLNLNTKRYATSSNFELPGLPPDAPRNLAEFRSASEGNLELEASKPFLTGGTQNGAMAATLQSASNPNARGTLEVRTRVELRF